MIQYIEIKLNYMKKMYKFVEKYILIVEFMYWVFGEGHEEYVKTYVGRIFFRTIPEMFILIWVIHIISRKSLDVPKYIISSLCISVYNIRRFLYGDCHK